MIPEQFVGWVWVAAIATPILIGFKIWFSFVRSRIKDAARIQRQAIKENPEGIKDSLDMWINHPNEAIEALKQKRIVLEKEGRTAEISSIDSQISMLNTLAKLPEPARPIVKDLGMAAYRGVRNIIKEYTGGQY